MFKVDSNSSIIGQAPTSQGKKGKVQEKHENEVEMRDEIAQAGFDPVTSEL